MVFKKVIFLAISFILLCSASCHRIVYISDKVERDTTLLVIDKSFKIKDTFEIIQYYDTLVKPFIAQNIYYINQKGKIDTLIIKTNTLKKEISTQYITVPDTNLRILEKHTYNNINEQQPKNKFIFATVAYLIGGIILGFLISFIVERFYERFKYK